MTLKSPPFFVAFFLDFFLAFFFACGKRTTLALARTDRPFFFAAFFTDFFTDFFADFFMDFFFPAFFFVAMSHLAG